MGRLQVDLVDLNINAATHNGVNYCYIIILLDVFSRYTWLVPLQKKSSQAVAKYLTEVSAVYGQPNILQYDCGSEFEVQVKNLLAKQGIKWVKSSPYHLQSQGKIERMHQTMKRMIAHDTIAGTKGNWVRILPEYASLTNDAPKEVLGHQTPFEVCFGWP